MARLAGITALRVQEALAELDSEVASLATQANVQNEPRVTPGQVVIRNVSADLAERSAGVTYPAFFIYCEKLSNALREKFRIFSGTARMVVEARASQDRLEGLETRLHVYADAVTNLLDQSRGDWGQGMFYTGGYEVSFGPVKHGGKNFLQTAKIVFDVEVSTDC